MHDCFRTVDVIGISSCTLVIGVMLGIALFAALLYYKDDDARKR